MNIQIGQTWKSKIEYPDVGYYTIKIVNLDFERDIAYINFTASMWADGHWSIGTQTISSILENYEKIK